MERCSRNTLIIIVIIIMMMMVIVMMMSTESPKGEGRTHRTAAAGERSGEGRGGAGCSTGR